MIKPGFITAHGKPKNNPNSRFSEANLRLRRLKRFFRLIRSWLLCFMSIILKRTKHWEFDVNLLESFNYAVKHLAKKKKSSSIKITHACTLTSSQWQNSMTYDTACLSYNRHTPIYHSFRSHWALQSYIHSEGIMEGIFRTKKPFYNINRIGTIKFTKPFNRTMFIPTPNDCIKHIVQERDKTVL